MPGLSIPNLVADSHSPTFLSRTVGQKLNQHILAMWSVHGWFCHLPQHPCDALQVPAPHLQAKAFASVPWLWGCQELFFAWYLYWNLSPTVHIYDQPIHFPHLSAFLYRISQLSILQHPDIFSPLKIVILVGPVFSTPPSLRHPWVTRLSNIVRCASSGSQDRPLVDGTVANGSSPVLPR